MKKDNSKIVAIVLASITLVVVILSLLFKTNGSINHEKSVVTDPSSFFTVNSCLYRTITYISSGDVDSLLKVVDSDYKKNKSLNKDNILSEFPTIPENSNFVSKKMYYEKINSNITKYYVYGIVEDNLLYEDGSIGTINNQELYFIVKLDANKNTFTVEPYDGKIFVDGD